CGRDRGGSNARSRFYFRRLDKPDHPGLELPDRVQPALCGHSPDRSGCRRVPALLPEQPQVCKARGWRTNVACQIRSSRNDFSCPKPKGIRARDGKRSPAIDLALGLKEEAEGRRLKNL